MFLQTKQLLISFLYFGQISQLMYNAHNNLTPENTLNMFQKVICTHEYRTRSTANGNFYVKNTRTEKNEKTDFIKLLVKTQFICELKKVLSQSQIIILTR